MRVEYLVSLSILPEICPIGLRGKVSRRKILHGGAGYLDFCSIYLLQIIMLVVIGIEFAANWLNEFNIRRSGQSDEFPF